jgi:hypothetical protein
MSTINQLPPERDLPADRLARLRARVLTAIAEPAARRRGVAGRRPGLAVASGLATAACAAIAIVGVGALSGSVQQRDEVYALGDGVLSPPVRKAGRECLKLASYEAPDERLPKPITWSADSPPVLLNHLEQPRRGALLVYQTQSTLIYCGLGPHVLGGPEVTKDEAWGAGTGWLDGSPWLPGPISNEAAGSTKLGEGYLYALGRVSPRVARVVLDDGAGHRSTARLANGTFVVFSDGSIKGGMLVSYDATGKEIDRRPALAQPEGRCYTDPAGNLVNPVSRHEFEQAYRSGTVRCRSAEPWSRRNSAKPTPQ